MARNNFGKRYDKNPKKTKVPGNTGQPPGRKVGMPTAGTQKHPAYKSGKAHVPPLSGPMNPQYAPA